MATKPAKTRAEPIPLTAEHRKRFEACVQKWQRLLNLGDWRIGVSVVPLRGGHLAASMPPKLAHRVATIRLAGSWDEDNAPTDHYLEETACHEVLHIFLHEMLAFQAQSGASDDDKLSAEHRVIQTLCTLMVPLPGLED